MKEPVAPVVAPGGAASSPTEEAVRACLAGVIDPELGQDIVSLGMVRRVEVAPGPDGGAASGGDPGGGASSGGASEAAPEGAHVTVTVALTVAGCPLRSQIENDVVTRVASMPGVASAEVVIGAMDAEERAALMARARWHARDRAAPTSVSPNTRILAVSSGKGGVGKSSVTVNLAAALATRGLAVGVLDADIWGFSIPRMLGMEAELEAKDGKMVPIRRAVPPGHIEVVSMGFLSGSGEDEAIMWRGPILNRALQHFLEDVAWGDLDYLLIDMPPGTGDIQMGLARMLPRTDMLIVTTPALAAQKVAARAADMARRGYLRVAGVIENMSAFECDHGQSYALFGEGGGQRLADQIGAPLLAQIPLDPAVAAGGDAGQPAVLRATDNNGEQSPLAIQTAFTDLAELIVSTAAAPIERAGCTARMLDHVEAALAAADTADA